MKRCLIFAAWLGLSLQGWGQSASVEWWSVDGGGTVITGGLYTVRGVIGQPDAGQMSGGNFSVAGGFLSVIGTVPPALAITLTTTNSIILSWPARSPGWQLKRSLDLGLGNWNEVMNVPEEVNGQLRVVLPLTPENQYYRLSHQ